MLAESDPNPPRRRPPYGIYAYTAREWDPEIGLYYYRARYYDPRVGRFISEDPIRWAAGPNFYTYVGNEPVNSVDPFGLKRSWPRRPRQPLPTPKLPCRRSFKEKVEEALEPPPVECTDPCSCVYWDFNEEECRWEAIPIIPDHCVPIRGPCWDKDEPCSACR